MGSGCSTEATTAKGFDRPIDIPGHSDKPKPLGMHISAVRKFLLDHPEVEKDSLTTSETNRAVIKPETTGTNKPYLDKYSTLTDNGVPLVAPATVFVSHAWRYSFASTVVDAMEQHAIKEPNAYFWFDLFANDQNAIASRDFNWFSDTFKGSIRTIGQVLLILHPWHSPIPLTRAWCLFEISTALLEKDIELQNYIPRSEVDLMTSSAVEDSKCLVQALSDIQAEKAQATSLDDRDKIFSVIKSSSGGFQLVNSHIKSSLREWYFSQLKQLASNAPENNELQLATANVATDFGFYEEALNISMSSLSTAETYNMSGKILGSLLNTIGTIHKAKGNLAEALVYCERSLDTRLKALGDNHPAVARSYNNLANIYSRKQEIDKALEYHNKALTIKVRTLEEKHPDIAVSYSNMANLYSDKGLFEEALKYNEKSLEIRLHSLGDKHPSVAKSYNNIANVHKSQGQLDRALEYQNMSLEISKTTLGEDHADVAEVYRNMAHVYVEKGMDERALEYYGNSLKITIKAFGENHPNVAKSLNKIAHIHKNRGQLEKAIECYEKSLSVRLVVYGKNHPSLAKLYSAMSDVFELWDKPNKASEYRNKAGSIKTTKRTGETSKAES